MIRLLLWGKPSLKVAYKVKLLTQSLKVAVMNWVDSQEFSGLLTWTGTNEDDITFINSSEVFEKLSDFHNYCHGRQQQMESLNREATENAIQLQSALADMDGVRGINYHIVAISTIFSVHQRLNNNGAVR